MQINFFLILLTLAYCSSRDKMAALRKKMALSKQKSKAVEIVARESKIACPENATKQKALECDFLLEWEKAEAEILKANNEVCNEFEVRKQKEIEESSKRLEYESAELLINLKQGLWLADTAK